MDALKLYTIEIILIKKTVGSIHSKSEIEKMDLEAGRSKALQGQLLRTFVIGWLRKY